MQAAAEGEGDVEVLTGLVEVAQLAFVAGKVVLHESAVRETNQDFQQNVSGLSGAFHLVKSIAVMEPAAFVIWTELRDGMGDISGEGPEFGGTINAPAETEDAWGGSQ